MLNSLLKKSRGRTGRDCVSEPGAATTENSLAAPLARFFQQAVNPPLIPSRLYPWIAILPGLLLAIFLRLPDLDKKPMHTDEAVQAATTGRLLDEGLASYIYDPVEYHGPTLYYLTLPIAALRGQDSYITLDEITLRLIPALFGIGLLLWLPLLRGPLGNAGILFSSLLLAASPAFVFYSRYYIQESLLVFFSLGLVASAVRLCMTGKIQWAIVAGLNAGLMHATKETSILTFAALLGSGIIAAGYFHRLHLPAHARRYMGAFFVSGILIAWIFLSSFGTNPFRGPADSLLTFLHYAGKAVENGHEKPWWWYIRMVAGHRDAPGPIFHERGLLIPGLLGLAWVLFRLIKKKASPFHLFTGLWFLSLTGIYSVIRYKTPWLVLNPLLPIALLAGILADIFFQRRKPILAIFAGAAFLFAVYNATQVARLATGRFASDDRNPYAYSHPTGDIVRACNTLLQVAKQWPSPVVVHVIANEYWPIPWYLRSLPAVGYWDVGQPPGEADIWILDDQSLADWDATTSPPTHDRIHGLRPGVYLYFKYRDKIWLNYLP